MDTKRVVITGAGGLLGWHAEARLHAANCAAKFKGDQAPYDIHAPGKDEYSNEENLAARLKNADVVLHFAGVNRGDERTVEKANPKIARALVEACKAANVNPTIVYANSTHSDTDTPYGNSKRRAGEILSDFAKNYVDLVLPHIFGECAKPFYNNVTATLIRQLIDDKDVELNPNGRVCLLHAGDAAQIAIDAGLEKVTQRIVPEGRNNRVTDLYDLLMQMHNSYQGNQYPALQNEFEVKLFNSYRVATYPDGWPMRLAKNEDSRGVLFEAVKGGSGGQTFLSTTKPGIVRGDHFHLNKVERFLVLKGEAIIRVRRVLRDEIWEYRVTGDDPTPIDMPTLHTHSIENIGNTELLTLFWTNEIFDQENPDTYADKVLRQ